MAVPSYTTDLSTFNACTSTTGWVEMTGMAQGGGADLDTDLGIVSDRCISELIRKTGLASLSYNNGTGVTIPTNGGFFVWSKYQAANSIGTIANGGVGVVIGSAAGTWGNFNMDGSDTYPYGGWVNYFVDPSLTPDSTNGTYNTTYQYCGTSINVLNAVSKGNPHSVDFIRYGRGESRFTNGDLGNGYATFNGFALINDTAATNRWGLLQDQGGSFLFKGLMSLGLSGTSVDFRDSNASVVIDDTFKSDPDFNRIEVHNASSRVDWDTVLWTALGTTSKGNFEVIDNADVNFNNSSFASMGTFIFLSNSTINTTTFRLCESVTQNGAVFSGSNFVNSVVVSSLIADNITNISDCNFESDGSNHGIEIPNGATGTFTFAGNTFLNYAGTDGSTGNEAIYNNSGGLVTINVGGGGDTPTIRNGGGASTVVNNNVQVTLTNMKDNTEVRVYGAGTITELSGIENATAGSVDDRSFAFSLAVGVSIDIVIHNIDYEYIRLESFAIPSLDSSLPIQQRFDRNYINPL